ncbi:Hypothetical predicted protein [Pelobates cultripes]|uniref:L1 transposable element RRM domain-containing protein n=1 Tax=Pelobates cultripes TaxID=61616 RepID=A0AAD1RMB9_PELCU|nr:Hypothetical predicted protein [Pelobates cultripes]
MASKKPRAQANTTPAVPLTTSKTSLRRYFGEKPEPESKSKMAAVEKSPAYSAPSSPAPSESSLEGNDLKTLLSQLPSKLDLELMFSKMERSFGDKLQSLHEEVSQIGHRVQTLEEEGEASALHLTNIQSLQQTHNEAILFLQRKIEDLDNRGKRNNLRIRGFPETQQGETEDIILLLTGLFNKILGRPLDTVIKFDRAHRALRPRALPQDKPRDIICKIHHFPLKEAILQKAKHLREIKHDDHKVLIFQDLAQSTLIARRALRPITTALSDMNIRYRWAYPFALVVTQQGTTYSISTPAEVQAFQQALKLPKAAVEDWTGLTLGQTSHASQKNKWQRTPKKRRRRIPSGNEQTTSPRGTTSRPT